MTSLHESLKALLPQLSTTAQRGLHDQVLTRPALYDSLKIPLSPEAATKVIARANAARIAEVVAHVEDPATLLFAARKNRSQVVRRALLARAEFCPPAMHARLFAWAREFSGKKKSLARLVATMSPAEILTCLDGAYGAKYSGIYGGNFGTSPEVLRAIDGVFARDATREDLARYVAAGRYSLAGVATILSQALHGTSPLMTTAEFFESPLAYQMLDVLTPQFPATEVTPTLARAINHLATSRNSLDTVLRRIAPERGAQPLDPRAVDMLVKGPIPNAELALHFRYDDGFMDAVHTLIPEDLELLLALCALEIEAGPETETSRFRARRRHYARLDVAALLARVATADQAELTRLAPPVFRAQTNGFVTNYADALDLLERYVSVGRAVDAFDVLGEVVTMTRRPSATQVARFETTMTILESRSVDFATGTARNQIRGVLVHARGAPDAIWRGYWLATTPVSDVLPRGNASHLAAYGAQLESRFADNADLWSIFSSLVPEWDAPLPELLDTVEAMYESSDQYVKTRV